MTQESEGIWLDAEALIPSTSSFELEEMEMESKLRLKKLKEESKQILQDLIQVSTQKINKIEEGSKMEIEILEEEPTTIADESDDKVNKIEEVSKMNVEAEKQMMELEKENDKLKEEINLLSSSSKCSDEDLERIIEENYHITKQIRKTQAKINSCAELFECMESQRLALLALTNEMVSTINQASVITGDQMELIETEITQVKHPTNDNYEHDSVTYMTNSNKEKRAKKISQVKTTLDDRNDCGTGRT